MLTAGHIVFGTGAGVFTLDLETKAVSPIASGGFLSGGSGPEGLAVLPSGDVLVAEANPVGVVFGGAVIRIEPNGGEQSLAFQEGGIVPRHVAVEPSGTIVVGAGDQVLRVDLGTGSWSPVSSGGYIPGNGARGLAVLPNGDIIVSLSNPVGVLAGGALVRIDPTTGQQSFLLRSETFLPFRITTDLAGDVLLGSGAQVLLVDSETGLFETWASGGFLSGGEGPEAIAVLPTGDLVVAEANPIGVISGGALIRIDHVTKQQTVLLQQELVSQHTIAVVPAPEADRLVGSFISLMCLFWLRLKSKWRGARARQSTAGWLPIHLL